MLTACLAQALALLPAPAPAVVPADAAYLQRLEPLALEQSLDQATIDSLRPRNMAQEVALARLATQGSPQARLCAVIGAGTRSDYLARALLRAACTAPETNTAVACLLSPAVVPPGTTAALAYLAQDPARTLAVRAAAIARLFDADEAQVWPLARALFEGGTRAGLDPPAYADWPQGPRWELPKRVVLIAFHQWLARQDMPPSPLEPNAAWSLQQEQLVRAEELWRQAQAGSDPLRHRRYAGRQLDQAQQRALFELALHGDATASRALLWLRASMRPWLRQQLHAEQTERRLLAEQILSGP